MYLSAERLAIANQAINETFEQTSIAWQAIPYWDTGDPGQDRVRNDVVDSPGFLTLALDDEKFQATLAQLGAPTPDALIAEVIAACARLAASVDTTVLSALRTDATIVANKITVSAVTPDGIMNHLIDARAAVEDAGYRAPSCLITNTEGLKKLNAFTSGYPVTDSILAVTNVNSLHRASQLAKKVGNNEKVVMLLIGRRQRIAHGEAGDASPGEEPVDLAVSVLPRLECVGEDSSGDIEMATLIRYVTRIKDAKGVVLLEQN